MNSLTKLLLLVLTCITLNIELGTLNCFAQATNGIGAGKCLRFNTGAEYALVQESSSNDFQDTTNFSISFWMKTSATNTINILSKHDPGYWNGYIFTVNGNNGGYCTAAGHISFYVASCAQCDVCSNDAVNDGNWHFITGVYNSAVNTVLLYVDGTLQADTGKRGGNLNNNKNLYIGNGMNGDLDELSFWKKALSQTEIRKNMCQKLKGNEAGLVSYWRFDEMRGDTIYDSSPNRNKGILVNSPIRTVSSAAIGDTSTYIYPVSWTDTTLTLHHTKNKDSLKISNITGTPKGVHVYHIDTIPSNTYGIGGLGNNNRYWGVFAAGGTTPAYTATYYYNGNPFVNSSNESDLLLFKRNDNAASYWINAGATKDTIVDTLTKNNENARGEYILGGFTKSTPQACNIALNKPATASGTYSIFTTDKAFDGNTNTYWNAGTWVNCSIQVDLQDQFPVDSIVFIAGMNPPGDVNHEIYTSPDMITWTLKDTLSRYVKDGERIIRIYSPALTSVRGIKIKTTKNPSWTAWPEIMVYSNLVSSVPVIATDRSPSLCIGDSVTLDAGTGFFPYKWSNGDSTQTITVDTAGTYTVTVQGTCSSTTSDSVVVSVHSLPTPSITGTTTICSKTSTTLTVSGGIKYLWNTNDVTPGITVSPTKDTTYSVTVTDTNNCKKDTSIAITVNPSPTGTITGTTTICIGDSTLLTASGGTKYLWSNNNTIATITVKPSVTTPYYAIVSGTLCNDTARTTVTVNPLPTVNAGSDTAIYKGNSVTLNAGGANTYLWQTARGLSSLTIANPVAKPTATTIYVVTGTDNNSCSNKDSITIIIKEKTSECKEFYIPNAFSPNGNSMNDLLYVRGCLKEVKEASFVIYDRWGNKVFETTDLTKGWDGTYNGKALNTAVFVYYLKATLITDEVIEQKGNVSLIR